MRKLSLLFALVGFSVAAFGQVTDAQTNTDINQVRTQKSDPIRTALPMQDLHNSKISTLALQATGTNTYVVSNLNGQINTYMNGQTFPVYFQNANTTAATININGAGAKALVKNTSTALSSGDIAAGRLLWIYYDGTNFRVSLGGSGTPALVNGSGLTFSTDHYNLGGALTQNVILTGGTHRIRYTSGDSSLTSFTKINVLGGYSDLKASNFDGSIWSKIVIDSTGTTFKNIGGYFGLANPSDTTIIAQFDVSSLTGSSIFYLPDGGGTIITDANISSYIGSPWNIPLSSNSIVDGGGFNLSLGQSSNRINNFGVYSTSLTTLQSSTLTALVAPTVQLNGGSGAHTFVVNSSGYHFQSGVANAVFTADATDMSFELNANGIGTFRFKGNSTQAAQIRMYEDTDNGTNFGTLKFPESLAANPIITFGANDVTWTTTGTTTVTLPTTGTLATQAGSETLTNKTLGSGATWNGNVVAGQYGGTGVANTGKTITVSGNTTIGSSTHTVAFVTSANTSVTLPTTGTLTTLAGSETFTNKTLTSPVINFGSDANGDIMTRISSVSARLAQGSNGTFLGVSGGTLGYYTPSVPLSALTGATGANTIDHATNKQTWTWNTWTAVNEGLALSSNSTSVSGSNPLLRFSLTGAQNSLTTTTMLVENNRTGTTTTNVAGYFAATGGTINHGLWVNAGSIRIGAGANAGAGDIVDVNNNELLKWVSTASAVNEITVTNVATANSPIIAATGGDTNIGLILAGKGNGKLFMRYNATDYDLTTFAPLATLGSALQGVRVNSGGTALEYYTPTPNPFTTNGDLLTQISGAPGRVGIGSTGQYLKVASGLPAWGNITNITGTTTNDNAAVGDVGEEVVAVVSTYANYTTTATYQNVTSITLTAGDWDLAAFYTFSANSSTITAASNAIFVISTTTASASGAVEGRNIGYVSQTALTTTNKFSDAIPSYRVSIASTTTYYLNTQSTFTVGNPQYVGGIRARRIR